ncbi:hypothetical protein A5881_000179 [Enterococcus termitis]
MEFFLNDKNNKKLELFKELIFREGNKVSFAYLQHYLDISLSTLKRYFNELEADIQHNENLNMLIFERNTGSFQLNNDSDFQIDYFVVHLRFYYLNESLKFKIISNIFAKNYSTADELADELFVSIPYLYKQINALNEQLKNFHLKLVFNSDENLFGEEKHLRMFVFYFYWNTYRGITVPFKTGLGCDLSYPDAVHCLQKRYSESVIKRIELILRISTLRQHKSQIHLPEEIRNVMRSFELSKEISSVIEKYFITEDEFLFFNLMIRTFISDIDSPEEKTLLFNSLSRSSRLVYSSELLIDEYEKDFYLSIPMTPRIKANIFYYTLLGVIHSIYFEVNPLYFFKQIMSTMQDQNDYFKKYVKRHPKNYNFYKKFRKRHPEMILDSSFNYTICMLLTFLTDMFSLPTVSIYIQYSSNNFGSVFIKNRLLTLFNPDTITFTTHIEEADIAIIDNVEMHSETKRQEFFFVNDFLDEKMWLELIIFIQKIILANKKKLN